jgi:Uncharacterized conserved protein
MVVVYPVYLIPDEEGYVVDIPDMKTHTEGKDLAEAIFMARDAIGQMGIYLEDKGREIPKADTEAYEAEEGTIRTLVDVDLSEYRRKTDNKMVKKNCTIPNYLNVEAEKRGINFSRVLQEALQEKLGMV